MAGKEAVVFLVDCNGESSLPAASPLWGGPVFESYFRVRHMNRGRFGRCHIAAPSGYLLHVQQTCALVGRLCSCLVHPRCKRVQI